MLASVFEEIKANPSEFLKASTGRDFEQRIMTALDDQAYNRILRSNLSREIWERLKAGVESDELAFDNPTSRRQHYIFQPYGSQSYPDFIVLDGTRVVVIEVKFSQSTQGHPVWNGGLPRSGGIYIFGAYGRQDVTFFLGHNVVSPEDARALNKFFDDLKERQEAFNATVMREQPYGFSAYSRKAFDQQKKHNSEATLDFFANPARDELEADTFAFLRDQAE